MAFDCYQATVCGCRSPTSPRHARCSRPSTRSTSTLSSSPSRGSTPLCRSEEHTSELQSLRHLVCRLLLEKKKQKIVTTDSCHSPSNVTQLKERIERSVTQ